MIIRCLKLITLSLVAFFFGQTACPQARSAWPLNRAAPKRAASMTKKKAKRTIAEQQPGGGYYPRPPVPDNGDFDDSTDDDFELGDQPNRMNPPPPPVPPPANGSNGDFQPSTPFTTRKDNGKLHFKIVEGEFWEKGKRRGRATDAKKADNGTDTQRDSNSY